MSHAIAFVLSLALYLPPSFDVPEVSTVQAAALALLVGVLTHQTTNDERDPWELLLAMVFETLLLGGFGLLFGWIFATWVGTA